MPDFALRLSEKQTWDTLKEFLPSGEESNEEHGRLYVTSEQRSWKAK